MALIMELWETKKTSTLQVPTLERRSRGETNPLETSQFSHLD